MSDTVETIDLACAAMEARLALIADWVSGKSHALMALQRRDGDASKRGMASAALLLSRLAYAGVQPAEHCDTVGRYRQYCRSLADLSRLLHIAAQDGKVKLRQLASRAPIQTAEVNRLFLGQIGRKEFRGLSIDSAPIYSRLSPHSDEWPDAHWLPFGYIDLHEFQSWVSGEALNPCEHALHPSARTQVASTAEEPERQSTWLPSKPKRDRGYGWALYRVLKERLDDGDTSPPTPHEVLDAWRAGASLPSGILRVRSDGFDYLQPGSGEEKTATLAALGKAIQRMSSGDSGR